MAVELSKTHYKIALLLLKYTPFIIGLVYFICAVLSCFAIPVPLLQNIFFFSPVTAGVFAYLSYVFKNCIWHRLPIYYCLMVHSISTIDYYYNIPIMNSWMLFVYLVVTILFILLGMYFKNRYNVRKRNKERST